MTSNQNQKFLKGVTYFDPTARTKGKLKPSQKLKDTKQKVKAFGPSIINWTTTDP